MKSFIKSVKLIYAGFLLGIAFMAWLMGDEEEKKKDVDWAGDNPSKMDNIYNHYKEKQNA